MPTDDPRMTDPQRLFKIMDVPSPEPLAWSAADLASMLEHQMAASLRPELERIFPDAGETIDAASRQAGAPIVTFQDLLAHAHPPIELLTLVKEFAKVSPLHPDHPLPKEVASVLYFAAIVVARDRHGQRISNLADDKLSEALRWVVALPWLDPKTRSLFTPRA